MSIDERRRLELADAAQRALGDDAGITLMEMLPPVGWADVATKQDLAHQLESLGQRFELMEQRFDHRFEVFDERLQKLEHRLEARIERGFRQVLVVVTALVVSGFAASIVTSLTR